MAPSQALINDYYAKNQFKMIECPYQFGNLKISANACLKRHEIAKARIFVNTPMGDNFKYSVGQSLLRCEQCPIVIDLLPRRKNKKK
jgi:hypothetical protein